MATPKLSFAGRKLTGLIFCTAAMVLTAVGTLSLSAAEMLDSTFAQNLTITVVGGIATLYGTFVGGNYGEHVAKSKNKTPTVTVTPPLPATPEDPAEPAPAEPGPA